jgi:uncharacterized protein (DUF4213/DUF364 family)
MTIPAATGRPGVAAQVVTRLADAAKSACVSDVRIGLGYTAVALEDGRAGLAYTFRHEAGEGCDAFRGLRPLAGRPASALLPLLTSTDPLEAAVGLACANALANVDATATGSGDVLEHLGLRPGDDVGMVGHFGPLVDPVRAVVRSLTIFERIDAAAGPLRPAREALEVLPRCHVALITATALLNGTLDDLLDAARGCREVVLLGPSTPLLPDVLGAHHVTRLSGVVVTAPLPLLQVVSEGGGTRRFGPFVRKVTVEVPRGDDAAR